MENETVLKAHEEWEAQQSKPQTLPPHVHAQYKKAQAAVQQRQAHEEAVATGKEANEELLAAYMAYIQLEQVLSQPHPCAAVLRMGIKEGVQAPSVHSSVFEGAGTMGDRSFLSRITAGAGAACACDGGVRAGGGHVPSHAPALAAVRSIPARQPESALRHQQGVQASCAKLPLGGCLVGRVSRSFILAMAREVRLTQRSFLLWHRIHLVAPPAESHDGPPGLLCSTPVQALTPYVHAGRALRALERAGCSDEEHRSQHEKALQAGLQTAEDYTEVS